jgi:L-ascorbate metabolism protein UlaG (beta-lactamase superfamily)
MLITHLGHSCLLIEYDDARILVDPGTLSADFDFVEDVDAILFTHQHPDHVDVERLPALVKANPEARVLAEPATLQPIAEAGVAAEAFAAGAATSFGSVAVTGVGGLHAVIHRDIPRVGNTGLVFTAEGSPTVFHPGDMIDTVPDGIDLLAVPLCAPWCAFKETADFVRAVAPAVAVPIHDAIVSPPGRAIYLRQTTALAPERTTVRDLAGAGPTEF